MTGLFLFSWQIDMIVCEILRKSAKIRPIKGFYNITFSKLKWWQLTTITYRRLSEVLVPLVDESLPPADEELLSVSLVTPNTTAPPRTNPTTKKQTFTTVGFISHRSDTKSEQSCWEQESLAVDQFKCGEDKLCSKIDQTVLSCISKIGCQCTRLMSKY